MSGDEREGTALANSLHRLEQLLAALEEGRDRQARECARELLQLVLDLHGAGFGRMQAIIDQATDGPALTERMIAEPHVRALLLLHGLHPHGVERRLRDALERMDRPWNERGFRVELLRADSGSAHVRLYKNGSVEPAERLQREIESILIDAAPDIDELVIDLEGIRLPARGVASPRAAPAEDTTAGSRA
jgi:hypothetical protein